MALLNHKRKTSQDKAIIKYIQDTDIFIIFLFLVREDFLHYILACRSGFFFDYNRWTKNIHTYNIPYTDGRAGGRTDIVICIGRLAPKNRTNGWTVRVHDTVVVNASVIGETDRDLNFTVGSRYVLEDIYRLCKEK